MRTVLPLGPEGRLSLVASGEATRLWMALEGASMPLSAEVSLSASGDGFDASAPAWAVVTGVAARGPRGDPVWGFANKVVDLLRLAWRRGRPGDEDEQRFLEDRQRLLAALAAPTEALIGTLQPERLRVCRRFAQGLRWPVYVALAADPSGRLGQLAAAMPGMLAFALTQGRRGDAQAQAAARAFREAVLRGEPLRRALPPLLEDWAAFGARRGQATLRMRHSRNRPETLFALSHSPAEDRARRIREQALLLRRARPGIAGTLLWLPPPIVFAPEDLPTGSRPLARWFKLMKGTVTCTAWLPGVRQDIQASEVRWLSRHATDIQEEVGTNVGADELLAYACDEGLVVPRDMTPETLAPRVARADMRRELLRNREPLADDVLEQLLEDLERRRRHGPVMEVTVPDDGLVEDQPLPAPIPAYRSPGLSVEPLYSTGQMRTEGIRMQHCVVSRIPLARTGRHLHFHVDLEERPLTLEVIRGRNGDWRLGECWGVRNSLTSERELNALRSWLKQQPPAPSP
jgi:hypothetical protein